LELVNGEVAVSPSPTPEHSHVVLELVSVLKQYVKARKLGKVFADVDTTLAKYDVRRPDILFFKQSRANLVQRKLLNGVPDLAIEVISPSSIDVDRKDKFAQYARTGIEYYWIVDPSKLSVEAFRLINGAYEKAGSGTGSQTVTLPPFPDLKIPLGDVWWADED
jgi:Uma2 family endonuclease